MNESTASRIEEIRRLDVKALRARFRELLGHEAPRFLHRGALSRRNLWQEQALQHGALSDETRARLDELARDPEMGVFPEQVTVAAAQEPGASERRSYRFRPTSDPRIPLPGTVLVRPYRGRDVRVLVRPDGFEHEGKLYPSLSSIAKEVTGSHLSGLAWFGLVRPRGEAKKGGVKT